MGGGRGINFGNTRGLSLDALSNFLTAVSFIPGVDTFADLAAIPVDLARGDYVSAGLDALGAIPFLGEIADNAKAFGKLSDTAKAIDKASDGAKKGKKVSSASDYSKFPKTIHSGRQGKHIIGHNNYKKGRSIFYGTTEDAQKLIKKYSGTGRKQGPNKEIVDFKRIIGKYVDPSTGKAYDTTMGTIHYSKDGAHIVPARPKINY